MIRGHLAEPTNLPPKGRPPVRRVYSRCWLAAFVPRSGAIAGDDMDEAPSPVPRLEVKPSCRPPAVCAQRC